MGESPKESAPIEVVHGRFIPASESLPDLAGVPISDEWSKIIEGLPNQSFATEKEARDYDSKKKK